MDDLEQRRLARLNREYEATSTDLPPRKGLWVDVLMLCFGVAIVVGLIVWNPMQI